MYITCQECNTTFRLNESLLKPAGSKVRCSQCGTIFIAAPPAPVVAAPPQPTPAQAPSSVKGSNQELAGIDLAELDSLLGPDRSRSATPTAGSETVYNPAVEPSMDLEEEDFDIDFETVLESDSRTEAPAPAGTPGDALEDLDLEMDFDLENEDSSRIASAPRGPVAADEFELNLDDVDLTSEPDATVFSDKAALHTAKDDSELTLDFSQDAARSTAAQDISAADDLPELELDLEDLELDLNGAPEAAAPGPPPAGGLKESEADDLLFSDLDDILDEAALKEDAGTRDKFDRKLKSAASTVMDQAQADAGDEDLEELAFELDAEYEDKPISRTEEPVSASSPEEDDSDIDLTEIELLLEDGDGSEQTPAAKSVSGIAPRPSAARDSESESDGGEIDLSELEAAIDMADTFIDQELPAGAEEELDLAFDSDLTIGDDLDLDLDTARLPADEQEPALEIESVADDAAAEDELDLTDLDGILTDDTAPAKAASLRSGDIELEFQIDDEQTVTSAPIQEQLDTITPESAPRFERPAPKPAAAAAKLAQSRTMPEKKKNSRALLIIFILVLLAAIGYGVYYAVAVLGIQIPYISDYLKPSPKDLSGIADLSTLEINSKFMENAHSGRLFVITGKVHNAYPHPREQIRLQGKLFTKGRVLSKTESVYAGNILSDQELVSTPWSEIKSRLTTPNPDANVLSNQSLPFMVVFSSLPAAEELDEFAVELVSSAPTK